MAEKAAKFDYLSLPSPSEPGAEFPHFGNLDEGDGAILVAKGWKPRDVRGITDSSAIRLMYFAARLGLIELSAAQMTALKEERMYWEQMAEVEARKKAAEKEKSVDILGLLEAFAASGASVGATPTPPKRMGRPPGSKNKVKEEKDGAA
jgi:hypothetical protein